MWSVDLSGREATNMRRYRRTLTLLVVAMVLLPLAGGPPAPAQAAGPLRATADAATAVRRADEPTTVRQVPPPPPPRDLDPASFGAGGIRAAGATLRHPKLESRLVAASRTVRSGALPAPIALDQVRASGVSVVGSQVRAIVEAMPGALGGARAAVRTAGGTVEAEYANLLQVLVPPANLEVLANDPAVAYVRTPALATREAVAGEGVSASGASAWQAAGVTGTGVKVGVIDFGFTNYQARQASGDLPATLTVVDFCNGQVATGGEHGTAVAEIVYEMAPGAQLYLLCINTEVQLGQAKDYAKANGINILSVSIGYRNTSRGDGSGGPGTPDSIAADARDNGILWVNSAGNYAQQHWSGFFTDVDGDFLHEFAPGDETQSVFLQAGQGACFLLKWDSWPTSAQDYDLYLGRPSDLTIVAGSAGDQTGSQPPTEAFCYTNPGPAQFFDLLIDRFDATLTPRFDLFITLTSAALQYVVPSGSLNDVAGSPKALAVGAVCWQNNQLEPYSSLGPTISGLVKPDIVGFDSVSSATYGTFGGCGSAQGFAGTSAAQPHVAGAAALVKQANPSFTPAQLQSFLEGRAIDQGPAGKDNSFGSGRLALGTPPASADLAITLADNPDPVIAGQNLTLTVSVTNNGPQTATGVAATVTLPASLAFQSSTCTGTKNGPSCSGLALTSGQAVQYNVVATATVSGTATTNASVTSAVVDPNAGNNATSQQTTIVEPAPLPVTCTPRPPVVVSTGTVGGRLQVTLIATNENNVFQRVQFGTATRTPTNALIDLPDGRTGLSGPLTVQIAPAVPTYTFWVRRAVAGLPTTVPMIVTDRCGTWETFVGGGGQASGF